MAWPGINPELGALIHPSPPEFRMCDKKLKHLLYLLAIGSAWIAGCSGPAPVVDYAFTDSLITSYQPSAFEKLAAGDLLFWQRKLAGDPGSYSDRAAIAGDLGLRFQLHGNMADLDSARKLLTAIRAIEKDQEPGNLRSLASLDISTHRFASAREWAAKALATRSEQYASKLLYLDASFESGDYATTRSLLNDTRSTNQYGYFFREAKYQHWKGEFDSAIKYMQKAVEWAGTSVKLKQTALSNLADLYFHNGDLTRANAIYMRSLRIDAADFHSLAGLGKIALLHDDSLLQAKSIFQFIRAHNRAPEWLFYLSWVAQAAHDSKESLRYATLFEATTRDSGYGNMYNKYLLQLYSGVLHQPQKALLVAEKEIANRHTPQAYAWYAWSLHLTGQDHKALEIYDHFVSGKPLEPLELYWMGKMMAKTGKGFNARAFFEAAGRNKFDLDPDQAVDLAQALKQ